MPKDTTDPALAARLLASQGAAKAVPSPLPPPLLMARSRAVQAVSTAAEARRMVGDLARLDVAFVGMDVALQSGDLGDPDLDDHWQDPLELRPLLVGLAAVVRDPRQGGLVPVRYAVDVRRPETHAGLAEVLGQPYVFVAHHLKSELFALAALGLPWPQAVFCTWLAAQLLVLGRHHARYIDPSPTDDAAEAQAHREARTARVAATALLAQLRQYGVAFPFVGARTAMQRRFLTLGEGAPFTVADHEAVTADAVGAAALYLPQRRALAEAELAHHFDHLELPSAVTLMEIEWAGVTVDRGKIRLAYEAAARTTEACEEGLRAYGFRVEATALAARAAGAPPERVMVESHNERIRVLDTLGLLSRFERPGRRGEFTFRKEVLKLYRDAHPVVRMLDLHRKYSGVTQDRLFRGEYVSIDGRVRPSINPLGAESGRVSFRRPNLVGVAKVLRPIVTPDRPDHELAEFDFVAQEVFIAAAHFGDPVLLGDCNSGDPYCEMIRRFCERDLAPGDALLDDKDLALSLGAEKFKTLRGRMKILMLATIYGMGDRQIAAQAGTTVHGAQRLRKTFFARYRVLHAGIQQAVRQLRSRGFTVTVTGLRRYRGASGRLTDWEKHWAVNAPIQGGSACIQKLLLPRMAAFMRGHGGRVVLPIFDAMLVDYPRDARDAVLAGVPTLMVEAMKELYPATMPRVDTTASAPWCWNKNNHHGSIERFLADPDFKP